jgi:hypothetical protein
VCVERERERGKGGERCLESSAASASARVLAIGNNKNCGLIIATSLIDCLRRGWFQNSPAHGLEYLFSEVSRAIQKQINK